MTQRKYDLATLKKAVDQAGASVRLIASYLGCQRSTVYRYLRKIPEFKAYYELRKGQAVEDRSKFNQEAFKAAIELSHGVKAGVAAALGCSRQTVDNYFDKWPHLVELFEAQRSTLVSKAVGALATDVDDRTSGGHQRAYMFVLKTLAKDDGFTERSEITGADGEALIPDDIRDMALALGLDVQNVMRHFGAMLKARLDQQQLIE